MRLQEMKNKKREFIKKARALVDEADSESRSLEDSEQEKFDGYMDDAFELEKKIEEREKLLEMERKAEEPVDGEADELRDGESTSEEDKVSQREGFARFAQNAQADPNAQRRDIDYGEFRDLQASVDNKGGYLLVPEEMTGEIIKPADEQYTFEENCRVIPSENSVNLGVVSLDTRPSDYTWGTEVTGFSADDNTVIGKREFKSHPCRKLIKVRNRLLEYGDVIDVASFLEDEMQYVAGRTKDKAYMTGTGNNEPLGIFTADADGISTSKDISTDMGTAAPTFDGLKEVKFGLPAKYRTDRTMWTASEDFVKDVAKIKDGEGRYIWTPDENTLLNYPLYITDNAPTSYTSGDYVCVFGDMRYYWVLRVLRVWIKVAKEIYIEDDQTGFFSKFEGDGQPVLEDAFRRGKLT